MSRFQFSLKALLVLPVLVGMVVVMFWCDNQIASRLMPFLAFGISAVMIANGKRYARAFGAASILPFGICAVLAVKEFFDVPTSFGAARTVAALAEANFEPFVTDYKFRIAFLWAAGTLSGAAGVGLTWFFSRDDL